MKLSYLINLVLLIVVAALTWLTFSPSEKANEPAKFSQLSSNNINSITIERNKRDAISLTKKDTNWELVRPIQAQANDKRVALLLNILNQPADSQLTIDENTQLATYGLAEPTYTLILNDHRFEFGDSTPLQNQRYVKHEQTIYIVDDAIAHLLNSTASSFIDNRLIAKPLTLRKLSLPTQANTPNLEISLENGHWHASTDLSQDKILSLIESWQNAYALQVLAVTTTQQASNAEITLWFNETDQPLRLIMQLSEHNLSLINTQTQLNYQFAANMAQQLLLTETTPH